ncbi:TetR/AcrR family transcriptional regulator [Streptomyces sp. ALB3]|uniref:TetR/AcrR family transcriptional regulator n=1 Tax=Streptomyces sp. ALB3 TaxID=3374278 RepID=UPI0037AD8359
MPSAREALLDSARSALPWAAVRRADVAAGAGVSRQTLYNQFGGKDGLGRALVRRAADDCLAGVAQALDTHRTRQEGRWNSPVTRSGPPARTPWSKHF